jgi:hypothetical protein
LSATGHKEAIIVGLPATLKACAKEAISAIESRSPTKNSKPVWAKVELGAYFAGDIARVIEQALMPALAAANS